MQQLVNHKKSTTLPRNGSHPIGLAQIQVFKVLWKASKVKANLISGELMF